MLSAIPTNVYSWAALAVVVVWGVTRLSSGESYFWKRGRK